MSDWRRVTRQHRCPICGKPDWCMVSKDGLAAICPRVQSNKYLEGSGYLHILADKLPAVPPPEPKREPPANMWALAMKYHRALTVLLLNRLAGQLGLDPRMLMALRMGWDEFRQAYTFPMRNGRRDVVGIALRNIEGRKWAVGGSHNGLFLPRLTGSADPLLICEGPTDTAAALHLGFQAVGRQSCTGGVDHLRVLLGDLRPFRVVIVADADGPGQKGAADLAEQILPLAKSVRLVTPPAKDMRKWLNQGAKRADVCGLIAAAMPIGASHGRSRTEV